MSSVGIISIDPGWNTAVAWGIVNPALRDRTSNWNAIKHARDLGSMALGPKHPYNGRVPKDGHEATLMGVEFVWNKLFEWHVERGMGMGEIIVACEHFEVRGVPTGADSRSGLTPVFFAGFLYGTMAVKGWGESLVWVRAGQHKTYATDDRIKRLAKVTKGKAGWIRGSAHKRDAWRIFCYMSNQLT